MAALDLWPDPIRRRLLDHAWAGAVAAFDADETLWHTDAGIGFLDYADESGVLAAAGGRADASAWYRARRAEDEAAGLMACATAFAGRPVAQVEAWAAAYTAAEVVPRIYPEMRQLIDFLHGSGARVFVVTASFEHAVRPGAAALGIPPERVVGIRLDVSDDRFTEARLGAVTHRAGKPHELRQRAGGGPWLAMGNSSSDRELLEAAAGLAVAINPGTKTRGDGTPSLAEAADAAGWPVVRWADPLGESPPA